MTPVQQIAEAFQCSERAAQEICQHGKTMAGDFMRIYDAYDLTHVLDAKRAVAKARLAALKKEFKGNSQEAQAAYKAHSQRLCWRAIPGSARTLFKHAKSAVQTEDLFDRAVAMANAGRAISGADAVTQVFLALHEARQLSSPDKVRDGRLVYESLRRDYNLLNSLGVLDR